MALTLIQNIMEEEFEELMLRCRELIPDEVFTNDVHRQNLVRRADTSLTTFEITIKQLLGL